MIFVDSNIPMYLVGAEHPNKRTTLVLLERYVTERERLVTNTEVLQEILYRYSAIDRRDFIQPALDALYGFIDEIFPITETDVLTGKDLLMAYRDLSSRDAVHAAQMKRLQISRLFSFDTGFDRLPGLERSPD